jgi:hypothetical protein
MEEAAADPLNKKRPLHDPEVQNQCRPVEPLSSIIGLSFTLFRRRVEVGLRLIPDTQVADRQITDFHVVDPSNCRRFKLST